MKANELRIGNYVMIGDTLVRVSFWTRIDALWYFLFGIKDFNYMKPIPIDEKWVLDFGFQKRKDGLWYSKNDWIEILFYDKGYEVIVNSVCTKNKHVHQLQNLYFALTGEEL